MPTDGDLLRLLFSRYSGQDMMRVPVVKYGTFVKFLCDVHLPQNIILILFSHTSYVGGL